MVQLKFVVVVVVVIVVVVVVVVVVRGTRERKICTEGLRMCVLKTERTSSICYCLDKSYLQYIRPLVCIQ